jgi:cbb3-type cytochrome oxidase maturation protein
VLLALAIMAVLAWAVWSGQFEDMEREGQRIFQEGEVLPNIQEPQHGNKP